MSKLLEMERVVYDQQHAYNMLGGGYLNSRIKLALLSRMQRREIVQTNGYDRVQSRLKRGMIASSEL